MSNFHTLNKAINAAARKSIIGNNQPFGVHLLSHCFVRKRMNTREVIIHVRSHCVSVLLFRLRSFPQAVYLYFCQLRYVRELSVKTFKVIIWKRARF